MDYSRVLCLDLGSSRIGVSVSDPLGMTAQGVDVLNANGLKGQLLELIDRYGSKTIVIGFPLNKDGSEGPKAKSVRRQSQEIEEYTKCDVILWDERFSTKEAQRVMQYDNINQKKQKEVIDMLAAQVILQSYLDSVRANAGKEKKPGKIRNGVKIMEDRIVLINDDGEEVEFIIDDKFQFEGIDYVVLCEDEDSDDALLFRLEPDDGGEMLLIEVEDDEEFDKVSKFYFEN
ncbi:MAG: Holliday junction resolvase RuvX [Eubacteriaceae bacterium]|nr:Holliday junction resolvase RuvX [Eubacteriaceae bacterium]